MKETRTATAARAQGAWNGIERRRVEKVVETLAGLRSRGESISEVAHDARNMVTALTIYCDLLEVPGVLGDAFAHYAQELRLVAAASRRLVEKLLALDAGAVPDRRISKLLEANAERTATSADPVETGTAARAATPRLVSWPAIGAGDGGGLECSETVVPPNRASVEYWIGDRTEESSRICIANHVEGRARREDLLSVLPLANLAAELAANRNLLAALAGPSIALTIETQGGAQAVQLTAEDLTRLLVNLVKNAAEAMPKGGRIALELREVATSKGAAPCLALTIEDNGPGIPEESLEKIFTPGYTARAKATADNGWPQTHRGLGLAIVRSIVEGAGGRITAANRPQGGTCFTLELPVRKTGTRD